MRISVTHSTLFRYPVPAHLNHHVFRLCPRTDGAQRVLRRELEITPAPAGRSEFLDQDGNLVTSAWFHAPVSELSARSSFEVEMLRENPFDFVLTGAEACFVPMVYPEPLHAALAPYASNLGISMEVREFARALASDAGWSTLTFLSALAQRLFETCSVVIRMDGLPLDSATTLRAREGSCRDLAMLFCDACRSLGLAARFVSGYEREAASEDRAYMHAWSEVFLPGGGWRGWDPSRGLAVSTSHVAVAAAREPSLAAPISGSYSGPAGAPMDVEISMRIDA